MNPIDLLDFTYKTGKIPPSLLNANSDDNKNVSHGEICKAYIVDFYILVTVTSFLSLFLDISIGSFMTTESLRVAQRNVDTSLFMVLLFPMVMTSYFFFSFFFNQGQTLGMKLFKWRIYMPLMSFTSSLLWAAFSSSVYLSLTLSYKKGRSFMEKKGWGRFERHDHLYLALIAHKDIVPISLVEQLPALPDKEVPEWDYIDAA